MGPHGIDDGRGPPPLPRKQRVAWLVAHWICDALAVALFIAHVYLSREYGLANPAAPDATHTFEFNQHGWIVYLNAWEHTAVMGAFLAFTVFLIGAGVCQKKLGWGLDLRYLDRSGGGGK